jgi:hypothetical protein
MFLINVHNDIRNSRDDVMKFKPHVARIVASLVPVLLGADEAVSGYNAPGTAASSTGIGMIAVLLILGALVIAGVVIYLLKNKPQIRDTAQPIAHPVAPAAPVVDARGNVFISYRREDSADVTGRINERLTQRYGHNVVFQDIDNIPLGVDFRQHLDRALSRCNVLLAVIGDRWIEEENAVGQRRIDDPRDHLRLELETALPRYTCDSSSGS